MSKKSLIWMNQVISRFNDAIENKLQTCLQNNLRKMADPSESTVLSMGVYTASMLSTNQGKAVQQTTAQQTTAKQTTAKKTTTQQTTSKQATAKKTTVKQTTAKQTTAKQKTAPKVVVGGKTAERKLNEQAEQTLAERKAKRLPTETELQPQQILTSAETSSKPNPAQYDPGLGAKSKAKKLTEAKVGQELLESHKMKSPAKSTLSPLQYSSPQPSSTKEPRDSEEESNGETTLLPPASPSKSQCLLLGTNASELHVLSFGQLTNVHVALGSSVRFKTPHLHFEFNHEDSRTTNAPISPTNEHVILKVEWLSDTSSINTAQEVDLEAPELDQQELVCDNIFETLGMIFYGKGQTISIQARMSV
jgi:hypothetical protein